MDWASEPGPSASTRSRTSRLGTPVRLIWVERTPCRMTARSRLLMLFVLKNRWTRSLLLRWMSRASNTGLEGRAADAFAGQRADRPLRGQRPVFAASQTGSEQHRFASEGLRISANSCRFAAMAVCARLRIGAAGRLIQLPGLQRRCSAAPSTCLIPTPPRLTAPRVA